MGQVRGRLVAGLAVIAAAWLAMTLAGAGAPASRPAAAPGCPPDAPALALDGFATADGAIRVFSDGGEVDPYFAIKSLLVAARLGLCVSEAAHAWVAWLLPRQRPDGTFARYCGDAGAWRECRAADADDALAATWVELLVVLSPDSRMPAAWDRSVDRSLALLAALRNARGTYDLSATHGVALLMDNVEVLSALRRLGAHRLRTGRVAAALGTLWAALRLERAIVAAFWEPSTRSFRPSSQTLPEVVFYPHRVAQLYPVMTGLGPPAAQAGELIDRFLRDAGDDWASGRADHFAWGLAAVALIERGRLPIVRRWLSSAGRLRAAGRWNVLDEAAYQGVRWRLAQETGA